MHKQEGSAIFWIGGYNGSKEMNGIQGLIAYEHVGMMSPSVRLILQTYQIPEEMPRIFARMLDKK